MKRAFTLAEVLIVVALIGVVSTITINVLTNSIHRHVTLSKLKVVYSTLGQAFTAAYAKDGTKHFKDGNPAQTSEWFTRMVGENLFIHKQCNGTTGCWNNGTKLLNGNTPDSDKGSAGIGSNNVIFVTSKGFLVNMSGYNKSNMKSKAGINTSYDGLIIYTDINGVRKPNIVGKDIFVLTYTKERGLLPAGADETDSTVTQNCKNSGMYCFDKVIRDGWTIKNIKL